MSRETPRETFKDITHFQIREIIPNTGDKMENLNLLEEKVRKTFQETPEEYFSCEIAGPLKWEFIEPIFDYFKAKGYKVRTHSTGEGIKIYVSRKADGVIQNA